MDFRPKKNLKMKGTDFPCLILKFFEDLIIGTILAPLILGY